MTLKHRFQQGKNYLISIFYFFIFSYINNMFEINDILDSYSFR